MVNSGNTNAVSRECANRTKIGSKTDSTVDGPENEGVREDEKAVREARRESRGTLFFCRMKAKRKLGECAHRWFKYGVGERYGKKYIGRHADAYHGSAAGLLRIERQFSGPPWSAWEGEWAENVGERSCYQI